MPMLRKITKEVAESTPLDTDQDVCTICGCEDTDENALDMHTDVYTFDRVIMCQDCASDQRIVYNEQ